MIQWYFRFKSGNFENGYYEVGNNKELAKELAQSEFMQDCIAPVSYTHLTLPTS